MLYATHLVSMLHPEPAWIDPSGVLKYTSSTYGQFHVTMDTTQKNKSSYAEYLVLVLYCTHITCHGFEGNMQIQLNNSEISPFAQLCEKL